MMTNLEKVAAWADGSQQITAAVELLIESGLLREQSAWIEHESNGVRWVDFDNLPDRIGGLSGGEQRVALFAASLASSEVKISLADVLYGLDRPRAVAVLKAAAAALGMALTSS